MNQLHSLNSDDPIHSVIITPTPFHRLNDDLEDNSRSSLTYSTSSSSASIAALINPLHRISAWLVWLTLFVDSVLLTLPISFLPLELQDVGHFSQFQIGVIFGAKAAIQVLANPCAGYMTNRLGVAPMMLGGSLLVTASTLVLAFLSDSASLGLWSLGRALQGLGSAMCFSSGMSHLADIFPTDDERGAEMGGAMGGIGFAVLVGPPLGGLLHYFGGRQLAFSGVGGICAALIIFQLIAFGYYKVHLSGQRIELPDLITGFQPLCDPYVLLLILALIICNGSVAMLEYLLPLRLSNQYHLSSLVIGLCFLPSTLSYFVATPLIGKYGGSLGRSKIVAGGLVVLSIAMITIPLQNEIVLQLCCFIFIGSGMSMLDGSVGTILATIMDQRHSRAHGYGLVFAGCDIGFSSGYLVGSYGGSAIADELNFQWACWCFAGMLLLLAPFIRLVARFDQPQPNLDVTVNGGHIDHMKMIRTNHNANESSLEDPYSPPPTTRPTNYTNPSPTRDITIQ